MAQRARRRLTGALAGALCVAAVWPAQADEQLSLYCSNLEEQCQAIASGFERATGVSVAMIRKSTGEFYAQIRAEAADPKGDVWWGGPADAHWSAHAENLLQPYRSPLLPELRPWARALSERTEGETTAIYAGALGVGYNADILRAKNIAPPRCWADLTKSEYRGEIQIANPLSSGTAFLFLAMTMERLGEADGFAYLRALDLNINQYTRSGDAPVKALSLGETGVGIAFLHGMTARWVGGAPVRTVIPCEGTAFEMIGASVLRGARHPDAARRFIDYALSKPGQDVNAALAIAAVPARDDAALAEGAPDLTHVRLIGADVAKYADPAERARLLKRFETGVRQQAKR